MRILFAFHRSVQAGMALAAVLCLGACSGLVPTPLSGAAVSVSPTSGAAISSTPTPQVAISSTPATESASTQTPTTISCTAPAALTPAVTEGPYFKAGSPERASLLETGVNGSPLILTGRVLTADCKPVAHALLDFWQADGQGQYDNSGFNLRGHQYTDANGVYKLQTVVPGLYPGRTEHIHVKVQAPGGPLLTTQLFFPGAAENTSDSIFNPALLVTLQGSVTPMQAQYNFVILTQ